MNNYPLETNAGWPFSAFAVDILGPRGSIFLVSSWTITAENTYI